MLVIVFRCECGLWCGAVRVLKFRGREANNCSSLGALVGSLGLESLESFRGLDHRQKTDLRQLTTPSLNPYKS